MEPSGRPLEATGGVRGDPTRSERGPGSRPCALTIAGSDPSGGAGLQADLKTFHQHGVVGLAAVALVTVQDRGGVHRVLPMSAELVGAQIDALLATEAIAAWKTGALANAAVVRAVAQRAARSSAPVVVDPVLTSTGGASLLDDDAVEAMLTDLMPRAALVMPNAPEAERLSGVAVHDLDGARQAASVLLGRGARAVLIKGGHLGGADAVDLLIRDGCTIELVAPRRAVGEVHGTGCAYAAAITAGLAHGLELEAAARAAKAWLSAAIAGAEGGHDGAGRLDFFAVVGEAPPHLP